MRDVNKMILIGRLGADPVLRTTKSGISVGRFPLATAFRTVKSEGTESSGSSDERTASKTQWHQVVVWGKQAEHCNQFLRKGDAVYLEGTVRSRPYQTDAGEERYSFEVHADTVNFLSSKRRGDSPDAIGTAS